LVSWIVSTSIWCRWTSASTRSILDLIELTLNVAMRTDTHLSHLGGESL
jgi:hypothetical protein